MAFPAFQSRQPQSAKETVASRVYARYCLASVNVGEPYSGADIEKLWTPAYQQFGQPKSPEQWVEGRIYLRDRLVEHGISATYTAAEVKAL
jgi:hypothetical protein